MKERILLGTISTIHENWLPYASGCLIDYSLQSEFIKEHYDFLSPLYQHQELDQLKEILKDVDILGLTCYVWNQSYNDELVRFYKRFKPNGITLYGGPNIPKDPSQAKRFALEKKYCDLFFVGMAEENFSQYLIQRKKESKMLPRGTFSKNYYCVENQKIEVSLKNNKTPRPYISGVFDTILQSDAKLKASFETNRGCPYSCSFCDWGGQSRNKLFKFSEDLINRTIHILYKSPNIQEIEILDANFGILKRDEFIIDEMIVAQQKHNRAPKVSFSGLAKNGSLHLDRIINKMFSKLNIQQSNMKISFQSHSKKVLQINNRDNIKSSNLAKMMKAVPAQKEIVSEIIMGLPGETSETWLETLDENIQLGIYKMRAYFLSVLPNTPLASEEFLRANSIELKKIRFPYAFKQKGYKKLHQNPHYAVLVNQQEFEEFTIIRECSSYDTSEIIKIFDYWWIYHNLYNSDALRGSFNYLIRQNSNLSSIILTIHQQIEKTRFLKSLIEHQRQILKKIYSKEEVTVMNSLSEYLFFSRSLRTNDLFLIWKNKNLIFDELNDFLPQDKLIEDMNTWIKDFSYNLYGANASIRNP